MAELSRKKSRVTVNAVYKNGVMLLQDQVFIADTRLLETEIEKYRVVTLRIVVPTRDAEDLHDALSKGEVELFIQDIPPRV